MSISTIRYDLYGKLKTFAELHSLSVAWEGLEFKKPTQDTWLEVFILPAPTINYTIDGYRSTWRGVFQVNIWSRSGKGMKTSETIADALVATFPIVPKSGYVSIEQTPSINPKIVDPSGWIITPVIMTYRYESTNVYYDGSSFTDAWTTFTNDVTSRLSTVEDAVASFSSTWETYTPDIYVGGSAFTGNVTRTAEYLTVGGAVILNIRLVFSALSSQTGGIEVVLPNVSATASAAAISKVTNINDVGFAGTAPFSASIDSGGNRVVLERLTTSGIRAATLADITSTTTFDITAVYKSQ